MGHRRKQIAFALSLCFSATAYAARALFYFQYSAHGAFWKLSLTTTQTENLNRKREIQLLSNFPAWVSVCTYLYVLTKAFSNAFR